MAVDLVQELVNNDIDPFEKFDRHNFRHVLIITIASIPLTSILIILFIVAVVKTKSGGFESFILIFFDLLVPYYFKLTNIFIK